MTVCEVSSASGPPLPTTRPGVATPAQLTAMRSSPSSPARVDRRLHLRLVAHVGRDERAPALALSSSASASPGEDREVDDDDGGAVGGRRRAVAPPRPEAPPVTRATVDVVDLQGRLFRSVVVVSRERAGG